MGNVAKDGVLRTGEEGWATATLSSVTASLSSQLALAANTARRGAILFNDADARCLVCYGVTASASRVSLPVGPGQFIAIPTPIYTGRIDVIWESGLTAGTLFVTEQTEG